MSHAKKLHQQRSRKVLYAVLYTCAGIFLVGAIFAITATLTIVDSIREDQKTNANTNERLVDCTDPKGDCYRQGQERTASVVDNIGRLSVYASACAADADPDLPVRQRAKEIQRCVEGLLEEPPAVP